MTTPDKNHNGGPSDDCCPTAYDDFIRLGGDHIGAEQYGCAAKMRDRAQKIIKDVFDDINDIVDDKDGTIHVGRIAERVYAQSTNTMRILRESLYAEPDDPDAKDDWDK